MPHALLEIVLGNWAVYILPDAAQTYRKLLFYCMNNFYFGQSHKKVIVTLSSTCSDAGYDFLPVIFKQDLTAAAGSDKFRIMCNYNDSQSLFTVDFFQKFCHCLHIGIIQSAGRFIEKHVFP